MIPALVLILLSGAVITYYAITVSRAPKQSSIPPPLPKAAPKARVSAFSPANRSAKWIDALYRIYIGLAGIYVLLQLVTLRLVSMGLPADSQQIQSALRNELIASALTAPISVTLWICILIWFYSVHKNLGSLGVLNLRYTPGWAVGGFLFPPFNFFRPLQVLREVWHGSDPEASASLDASEGTFRTTPSILRRWWAFQVLTNLTLVAIPWLLGLPSVLTQHQHEAVLAFGAAMIVVAILAGLQAMRIVRHITAWQSQRYHKLTGDPAPTA